MAKITIPIFSPDQSCAAFFQELIKMNKIRQPKFSHRFLALCLDWPISYVADLTKGRKRFTVSRALELAQYAKLNVLETEKMIYLALSDNPDKAVQAHFTTVLRKKTAPSAREYNQTTSTEKSLFESIEVGAIFEVLKWARLPLKAQEIKSLLYTFHDLSVEKIESIIQLLIRKQIIEMTKNKLVILKQELVLDQFDDGTDGGLAIHRQYAQNFIHYTQKPQFPGFFTSGFVEIQKEQFHDVAKRFLEIRNWLLQLALENSSSPMKQGNANSIYQFDFNLVLILDKIQAAKPQIST